MLIFKSVSYLLLARDGDGGGDTIHALTETVVVHDEAGLRTEVMSVI